MSKWRTPKEPKVRVKKVKTPKHKIKKIVWIERVKES